MNDRHAIPAEQRLAYSIKQFANATSLSERHVRYEIAAGRLRVIKSGHRALITRAEADRYIAELEARAY